MAGNEPFMMAQIFSLGSKASGRTLASFFIKSYSDVMFYIHKSDIIRNLTPEEIEEFELRKASYKYNL